MSSGWEANLKFILMHTLNFDFKKGLYDEIVSHESVSDDLKNYLLITPDYYPKVFYD